MFINVICSNAPSLFNINFTLHVNYQCWFAKNQGIICVHVSALMGEGVVMT